MQSKKLILFFLVCLLVRAQNSTKNACSAYCQNCITSVSTYPFYTCRSLNNNGCPSNFITSQDCDGTQCSNCTADYDIFVSGEDLGMDLTSLDIGQCGFFGSIMQPAYGRFNTTTGSASFTFWQSTITVPAHYDMRVYISVVYIDRWRSGNVSLYYNYTDRKTVHSYASGVRVGYQCRLDGNLGGGGGGNGRDKQQRYGVLRYTNTSHRDSNFVLSLNATTSCENNRQCALLVPQIIVLFKMCHEYCLVCSGSNYTQCSECATTPISYYLSGTICNLTCEDSYFENGTYLCYKCNTTCGTCETNQNNCLTCKNTTLFLNVLTNETDPTAYCLRGCLPNRYFNTTQNQCLNCTGGCLNCTGDPSPCSKCDNTTFLYSQDKTCIQDCPAPLINNRINRTCQNCSVYCVNMTLSKFNGNGAAGMSPLTFDLNFTYPLDWNTFDKEIFQNIQFGGSLYSISSFNVTYTNLSSRMYRITINPYNYAFIINQSVTITVRSRPTDFQYTSNDSRPFMDDVFNQTITIIWTYIKPPNMTPTQYSIVSELSTLSSSLNNAFKSPGLQQLKKFGFLLLFLNSLQITSCLILINTILPQNLYEGIRLFASLIFYDVPVWQAESNGTKYVISVPISNISNSRLLSISNEDHLVQIMKNQIQWRKKQYKSIRLLSEIYVDQFQFRRTGFSAYFIYDSYAQIMIIILCYLVLAIAIFLSRYWQRAKRAQRFFRATLAGFHQISVIYFTITIVFEVVYFNNTKMKWISIVICFVINLYFLLYQLKVYYNLLDYPMTPITSPKFQEYTIKYSYYLKWLRFDDEKRQNGHWGIIKTWFRPHNYHIQSYVKKFLMMLAFPLFFYHGYAQIVVLMIIQAFEIMRFIITWPYNSKWRNIYRLVLEVILETIFCMVLFIRLIVVRLTSGNNDKAETYASLFFVIGWFTFALVYIFNIGFLFLFCVNWFYNCNYSNRQILEQSRKTFYFNLLKQHEDKNQLTPTPLMTEWMKKGNIYGEKIKELPQISYRMQYYNISKDEEHGNYLLDIKVIIKLEMDSQYNFIPNQNNLVAKSILEKRIIIHPMSEIFKTIQSTYKKLASNTTEFIIIKTFMDVQQNQFKCGQQIPLMFKKMTQQIEIHDRIKPLPSSKVLQKPLPGFPISHQWLARAVQRDNDYKQVDLSVY